MLTDKGAEHAVQCVKKEVRHGSFFFFSFPTSLGRKRLCVVLLKASPAENRAESQETPHIFNGRGR